jgi:hypothetical protein
MTEERIKKWEKDKRLLSFFTGNDEELIRDLTSRSNAKDDNKASCFPNTSMIIEACKELIYNIKDGKPVFHAILYGFNVDTGELDLSHKLDILVGSQDTNDEIEEKIINTLAIASAYEIPVYPNKKELEPELARYHRKMLIEGFTAPDDEGNRVKLILTKSPGMKIDDPEYLHNIDLSQTYSPSDLALIRNSVLKQLKELRSADKILANLKYSAEGLSALLESTERNENALQSWLTDNPILFGTEYQQIIPKHQLGSEYEMDYALIRHSGIADLVEIESSNLRLFNKNGNPSQYLVHAEQQVMDWLEWIESYGDYARRNLSGAYNPKAFVVIGCENNLIDDQKTKLKRRNLLFKGQIEILTYNDLLRRAINIREQLVALDSDA